jgi:hypothetical protein
MSAPLCFTELHSNRRDMPDAHTLLGAIVVDDPPARLASTTQCKSFGLSAALSSAHTLQFVLCPIAAAAMSVMISPWRVPTGCQARLTQLDAWQRKCRVLLAWLHRYQTCRHSLCGGSSTCCCQQAASLWLYAATTLPSLNCA